MAGNLQQAEQAAKTAAEQVKARIEGKEGPEQLHDVVVTRVAKLLKNIKESSLNDEQKIALYQQLRTALDLLDQEGIEKLIHQFEPVLSQLERGLPLEVKQLAGGVAEAKLESIRDAGIREQLSKKYNEAQKQKEQYRSARERLDGMIESSHITIEGTELQLPYSSLEYHSAVLENVWTQYRDIQPQDPDQVKKRGELLDQYLAHVQPCLEVVEQMKKRIAEVRTKPLREISLENRSLYAGDEMVFRLKKFEDAKKDFWKRMEALHMAKDDPFCLQVGQFFEGFDMQMGSLKEKVFAAKGAAVTPEAIAERTVAAEQANKNLKGAAAALDQFNELVDKRSFVFQESKTYLEGAKIAKKSGLIEKLMSASAGLVLPQIAVYAGYAATVEAPMSTEDKVLEGMDFGISLIPFGGGVFDVVMAVKGSTLSGREMKLTERLVRGGIGLGSFALDCFTFGAGGVLLKAGGKAAIEAGAKVAAKSATKVVIEAGAKGAAEAAAKGMVESGGKVLTKEGVEIAAKTLEQTAAKEGINFAAGTVAHEAIVKGLRPGATLTEKALARKFMAEALTEQLKPLAAKLAQEAAAKKAAGGAVTATVTKEAQAAADKYMAKLAKQNAALAAPYLSGFLGGAKLGSALEKVTLGAFEKGGIESVNKGLLKVGQKEAAMKAAEAASKSGAVFRDYYWAAEFMKNGEFAFGKFAKSIGKEMGTGWLRLHDPRELLRTMMSPFTWLKNRVKSFSSAPKAGLIGDRAALQLLENEAKMALISDGKYDPKLLDELFNDARRMTFDDFMKAHPTEPMLKEPEAKEFFESYCQQFQKSTLVEARLKPGFPFIEIKRGQKISATLELRDLFKKMTADSLIVSTNMLRDARKLTWDEFIIHKDYKVFYDGLGATEQTALKTSFEKFQALCPTAPVNRKHLQDALREEGVAEKAVKDAEAQLVKLKEEERMIDGLLHEHESELKTLDAKYGGYRSNVPDAEKQAAWFSLFEKLPEGELKKQIIAERDNIAHRKGLTLADGSPEMKEVTGQAMDKLIPATQGDIKAELPDFETALRDAKDALQQKSSVVPLRPKPLKRQGTLADAVQKRAA